MGVFGPGRMIQVFSLFDIMLSWGAVLAPLSTSETTYLDSSLINLVSSGIAILPFVRNDISRRDQR